MIYRAIQLIQIFLADGRTDERTKVFQEDLADLKKPPCSSLTRDFDKKDHLADDGFDDRREAKLGSSKQES